MLEFSIDLCKKYGWVYLVASLRGEKAGREAGGVAPRLVLGAVLLFDKWVVKTIAVLVPLCIEID